MEPGGFSRDGRLGRNLSDLPGFSDVVTSSFFWGGNHENFSTCHRSDLVVIFR